MKDFTNIILGQMSIGTFCACFVIALIGAIGLVLYRAIEKADKAKGTPNKFSWSFFWRDNFMKWFLQVLTIALSIRLSSAALVDEAVVAVSLGIGLASGQFSIWTQGRQNEARDN